MTKNEGEKKPEGVKEPDGEKKRLEELTDTLKRLQAEFENYQKRSQKELEARFANERACIIRKLLPIVDSFEIALNNSKNQGEFHRGMELIYAQMTDFLAKEGLKAIDAKGRPLDPFLHEVMLEEPSEQEGQVIEELQKGYTLNGAVLRHSKVKIGKKRHDDGTPKPDKRQPA